MSLNQTERMLLMLLRSALQERTIDPAVLTEEMDWNGLLNLAAQHKLLPMIVSAIPTEYLPNARILKQTVIRQVVNQTVVSRAFLSLYEKLRQAGFHPLVVKGIVCRSLYPQGDLRPSGDEDLIVPDHEFEDCCAFLQDLGMEPVGEISLGSYEIGWQKPGDRLYIELHRSLFPPDSKAYGDLGAFFEHAAEQGADYPTAFGAAVRSLSAHDHLLYLLLHAYKHFLHSGFGIRQVSDIGLWVCRYRAQIDWDRLSEQCAACNTRQFAAAVFGIALHFLEIPLELPVQWRTTPDYCEPLLRDVLTGGIYGVSDGGRQHASTVTLGAVEADRVGGRTSIWKSVFLKRADMEKKYPYLKKYPILLPVAWCQRIWRYLSETRSAGGRITASITVGNERVKLLRHYGIIK